MVFPQLVKIISVSLRNWRARQELNAGLALWETALGLESGLYPNLSSKGKLCFSAKRNMEGKLKIKTKQCWMMFSSPTNSVMQVSSMLPCSLLYASIWPLLPKHDLKKYPHECRFHYFLNLSGSLRLLLSPHCPNRIDGLMNGWPVGWAFRSSHSPSLGRFIKDEGKTRREEYPVGCSCSSGDLTLCLPFYQWAQWE